MSASRTAQTKTPPHRPQAPHPPPPPYPRLALVLLTLVVLAVHAWLLQAWPDSVGLQGSTASTTPTPLVFNTRRVETAASQPAAAPPAAPSRAVRSAAPLAPGSAISAAPAESAAPDVSKTTAQAESTSEASASAKDTTAEAPHSPATPGQASHPLVVPATLRLNYEIGGLARGIHYSARAALTWLQEAGRYDAKLTVSVFLLGERSLSSTGEVTADGLVPRRFADKSRSEVAAHFLPEQGRISFSANTPDVPWQRGAQDRLSVFFQLASLMAGDPARAVPGTQLPLYVVGPRDAEEWVFKVGAPETITLPMGPTPTIYLLRLPRREYEQKTELWLAPQLGYLPVRIKQTHHNGDYVDQQLATSSTP